MSIATDLISTFFGATCQRGCIDECSSLELLQNDEIYFEFPDGSGIIMDLDATYTLEVQNECRAIPGSAAQAEAA